MLIITVLDEISANRYYLYKSNIEPDRKVFTFGPAISFLPAIDEAVKGAVEGSIPVDGRGYTVYSMVEQSQ